MHSILFYSLVIALSLFPAPTPGANGNPQTSLHIDLGDIPARSVPPEYAFERFFQTRPLGQIEFSHDNRSLYFIRNDGRVDNLFTLELASGAMRQLTRFAEPVSEFMVDHQGQFLVIVQDVRGNEGFDLYRYDLQSGQRRRLTDAGRGDTTMLCGLSPDDALLYYAQTQKHRSAAGLWQLDIATGTARELVAARGRTLECDRLSADGRYLLFGELIGFDERHLGLVETASGRTRTLLAAPGVNNVDADFAGDQVYFRSALGSDRFRLWRYRIGAGAPVPVRLPFDNDLQSLAMYADGRVAVIGYRSALSGRSAIFIDGFEAPRSFGLPPGAIVGGAFSDSNPGLGIVSTETANMPRRYYLTGSGKPVLLYDANRSGIDSSELAESRSLLIPSFDGLPIPVHLFIPNGTSKDAPRPVIFLIHGGPEDHVDPLYLSGVQFLANRGFIVVAPNVRGSTGFGKNYAYLDNGDWGGGHIRDTVALAAAVRGLDFVDAENLFVIGTSFGGFSVMSLISQYPDTFRAAVDLFGFTELATFVDSWPAYLQRHLSAEIGFDPRSNRARNRALSPLYHVGRIKIPLQIHQGANDSRVPRQQSDRMVQRMRALGRSVEYFVYDDEGHGFTRFANERAAYQRIVAFLRRQLKQATMPSPTSDAR